jgi:hypothetical protein
VCAIKKRGKKKERPKQIKKKAKSKKLFLTCPPYIQKKP